MALEELSNVLVIGNGESRRDFNLESYRKDHVLVGCNALHRDTTVDHLICCDRRMAEESTNNPNNSNTIIYVRPSWFHFFRKIKKNKNIRTVPELPFSGQLKHDDPDHWGSGGFAVLLAASLSTGTVELVGFDLHSIGHTVNNIYKGTDNYSKAEARPVDPSYWIYQIGRVFAQFPDINFIIRNHQSWTLPTEWQKYNVKFVAL